MMQKKDWQLASLLARKVHLVFHNENLTFKTDCISLIFFLERAADPKLVVAGNVISNVS